MLAAPSCGGETAAPSGVAVDKRFDNLGDAERQAFCSAYAAALEFTGNRSCVSAALDQKTCVAALSLIPACLVGAAERCAAGKWPDCQPSPACRDFVECLARGRTEEIATGTSGAQPTPVLCAMYPCENGRPRGVVDFD
ncbi:MAG: hypothetical protein GMKNLPBB_01625 [Myxococcota bacterium]|nr:hypothetical protein [Myxococcota bacterium]